MELVNGNGLSPTPTGFPPGGTPSGPALFFFNDSAATEIYTLSLHDALPIYDPTEQVTVNPDSPTLSTIPDRTSVTLGPPVTLHDAAFLQGGFNPRGSITFTLVGPDGTTVVDTEMVLVNGNGLYSTPTGFTPMGP